MNRPDLVLICTDQQRADSLGCAGNPVARTPNIDRLAATGTRFARHHTPMQICSPSRASMFTGLWPRHHGLVTNGRALDPARPTLAGTLVDSGYRTHSVGKQHLQPILAPAKRGFPDSRAFWQTDAAAGWQGPYYGFERLDLLLGESDTAGLAGHYARWLAEQHPGTGDLLKPGRAPEAPPGDLDEIWTSAMPAALHYNTWITDRAVQYIEAADDPFFLFVSYPDPHHPFAPPAEYAERWDWRDMPLPRFDPERQFRPDYCERLFPAGPGFRKRYWAATDHEAGSLITTDAISDRSMQRAIAHTYAMIEMIDDGVGRILAALEQHGRARDTVILFTSDHGELLGSHGLLHKGPPSCRQLTEIAFIASGPGIRAGATVGTNTSHVDLTPTLLELAGATVPDGLDGVSLVPLLDGSRAAVREYDFGEYHPTVLPELYNQTVRTDRWRLSLYPDRPGQGELFDHAEDPGEDTNRYHDTSCRTIRGELAALLADDFPARPDAGSELICKW